MAYYDAHVYIGGRKVATTTYDSADERLFSDVAFKKPRDKIRARPADCAHLKRQSGYVYVDYLDEHWPMEFCDDCLTILHGRSPSVPVSTSVPLWERTEVDAARDLAARRWNAEWPRAGEPRRKRPPRVAWPESP